MTDQIILHPASKHQVDLALASSNLNSIGVYGQEGSGKHYLAEYLARNILQVDRTDIAAYLKILDCTENIGIDQIRDIKKFLQLKVPSSKRYSRVVIVERLELLGIPAQNSLLKTVEEPPDGTVIIVTTANKNNILSTIISRLQWINLNPLSKAQLEDKFFDKFDKQKLVNAYALSQGNAGSLVSLANNSDSNPELSAALSEAKKLLSSTRYNKLARVELVIKSDEYSLDQLLFSMSKLLRAVIDSNSGKSASKELVKKLGFVVEARQSLKYKPSPKLLLCALFNKL